MSSLTQNAVGERETVLVIDASDLGFKPGKWEQTIFADDGVVFTLAGFSRNVEGEIIVALYTNDKHEILRVFND